MQATRFGRNQVATKGTLKDLKCDGHSLLISRAFCLKQRMLNIFGARGKVENHADIAKKLSGSIDISLNSRDICG